MDDGKGPANRLAPNDKLMRDGRLKMGASEPVNYHPLVKQIHWFAGTNLQSSVPHQLVVGRQSVRWSFAIVHWSALAPSNVIVTLQSVLWAHSHRNWTTQLP